MMEKMKNKWMYLIVLLTIVIISKTPTMNLDYHWDALVFTAQAKHYSIHGFFSTPLGSVVHVPFYTWLLSIFYKIFGETPFLTHFIIAIFSFLGAYFTYLLGKFLYSEKVGIIASLLLFFSTSYFALSGQAVSEIPLTAMTMMTLYFGLRKKIILYLISASILVITKEPGVFAVIALAIYQFFQKEKLKNFIMYSLPISLLLLWQVWMWYSSGSVIQPIMLTFSRTPLTILIFYLTNLYQILFWNYNWILTLFIVLTLISYFKKKNKLQLFTIPLFLTFIFYISFFSIAPTFSLSRYIIPIAPLFYLLSAYSLNFLFKNRVWVLLLVMIFLFISAYRWNWGIKGIIQDPIFHSEILYKGRLISTVSGELSLDYIDIVEIETKALNFLFGNYPNSTVTATCPLVDLPYITKSESASIKNNVGYRQWSKYNITVLYPQTKENIEKSDFVIYEPYCWTEEEIPLLNNLQLIETFQQNNKFVSIYRVPS